MLLMRTIEDPAHPVGKLVSTKLTLGLDHFALAMTHLGPMALSHGLCMGRRQLTILTPPALFLTWRLYLWDLISPLTLAHSNRSAPLSARTRCIVLPSRRADIV